MYKILVVDDEYEIRNGICSFFPWNQIGFQIAGQAENGKQALDFITKNHVDVILCDIMMPIMTGLELAAEIYSKKIKIKIVFLSGYDEFELVRKAFKYGAKDYLLKSTEYNELFEVFLKIKKELDEQLLGTKDLCDLIHESEQENLNASERIIANVKKFVSENYKMVTLELAAKEVHMNASYLSTFFKEKTGQNFSDYVISVKMHAALKFMKDVNPKIYEISEMVGYSSAKNFTRTFKKYFGKSPRELMEGK